MPCHWFPTQSWQWSLPHISNLVYSPEGFQAFNCKMPFGAAWLSHRVLVSEEASFFDRFLKIDCPYPLDTDKMFVVLFIECPWNLNTNQEPSCSGSG